MTCWTSCTAQWRAVSESTSCTRTIGDGTVISARLTLDVTAIRYDTSGLEEHEFDGVVKIYEHYTGDPSETLVFNNVETFESFYSKIYYKYNEWEVQFNDIQQSPAKVQVRTKHKALCPGCSHAYICDCDDTISKYATTTTIAPDTPNNPDTETMTVELLDVAGNQLSVYANVKIYRDSVVRYDANHVIYGGNYVDISESDLTHDWRVNVDAIPTATTATFQLCFGYSDSGTGSGSTGSGILAVQYFNTAGLGYVGGVAVNVDIDNPMVGGGNCSVPTTVLFKIYEWDTDYATTMAGTPVLSQTYLSATEDIHLVAHWMPFIFDIDLPEGEYVWALTTTYGPHDGSFTLIYINHPTGQKWSAWVNGVSHNNFRSRLMGVATAETYEPVLGINDVFHNYTYRGLGGCDNIKVNTAGDYVGAMSTRKGANWIRRATGWVGVENPSFETGDFTNWTTYTHDGGTLAVSNTWASDGTFSAKSYKPAWMDGGTSISQVLTGSTLAPGWLMKLDMNASGAATYKLQIRRGATIIYDAVIANGTNTIQCNFTAVGTITIETYYGGTGWSSTKTVCIDNIRFVAPPDPTDVLGNMIGGAPHVRT